MKNKNNSWHFKINNVVCFHLGDIFELDTTRPWEFNTSYPLRSVVVPYVTVGIPCHMLKWVSTFTSFWLGIDLVTPYILLVVPRLVTCGLSLISDFCLWYMCYMYGQNYAARLTVFASSYVMLVFATRTFSNTVEMVFFSMLLCLVLDSMHFTDEVSMIFFSCGIATIWLVPAIFCVAPAVFFSFLKPGCLAT